MTAKFKKKLSHHLEELKIENFYWNYLYPHKNPKNMLLKNLLSRVFCFILITAILFFYTEGHYFLQSIFLSLILVTIYHLFSLQYRKIQLENAKKIVNNQLSYDKFWKDLRGMEHEEFAQFIHRMLNALPEFSHLELTPHLEAEGIDLVGEYKDELMAIQCHILDDDEVVEASELRKLSKAMGFRHYRKAFVFSSTDFTKASKNFVHLVKDKRKLILLNGKDIYQMASKAEMVPTSEGIKHLIKKKIESKERKSEAEKIFNKKQVKPYFIYGTILMVLSLMTNLFYLYFISASLLYMLGLVAVWKSFNLGNNDTDYTWENKVNS